MMMIFTMTDCEGRKQTYEGIRHVDGSNPINLDGQQALIAVQWDGDVDLWIVDGQLGFDELHRFYRMNQEIEFVSQTRVPCLSIQTRSMK